jgi:release factor glutamine methyltransferase
MDSRELIKVSRLPAHEAVRLLMTATGHSRSDLLGGTEASDAEIEAFHRMQAARLAGEPLQYLEGSVAFGPLELLVDRRVLIPRPETEYLFELAAGYFSGRGAVVDLCTGSGALALALKHRFGDADVFGADLSTEALEVARLNSRRLGLSVAWYEGDLFDALPSELRGKVHLLVSNPPYVSEAEWDQLPTDVRHEPRTALVAGPSGLEVIERILVEMDRWLAPGGTALIEVGDGQAYRLRDRFPVSVIPDLAGRERYVRR